MSGGDKKRVNKNEAELGIGALHYFPSIVQGRLHYKEMFEWRTEWCEKAAVYVSEEKGSRQTEQQVQRPWARGVFGIFKELREGHWG